jgi:ketosteroid isomerase-like protein
MIRKTLTALACLFALALAAGCGESESEQAREVVQDYADARESGDFEAVCELLSESLINELQTDDCPAFIAEQTAGADGAETIDVVDVRTSGDTATADLDVSSGSEGPSRIGLRLEQQDGEWRITGLQ